MHERRACTLMALTPAASLLAAASSCDTTLFTLSASSLSLAITCTSDTFLNAYLELPASQAPLIVAQAVFLSPSG